MQRIIDVPQGWRTSLRAPRDPRFLAFVGALLLMCAPVLPGLSRLVVLPALLLAPGYTLLRLLGPATSKRSVSVAVPASLVLAICASLVLDVSGIRLGPGSLGLLLGAVTALLLVGSFVGQLNAVPRRLPDHDRLRTAAPSDDVGSHDQRALELARPGHPAILQAAPVLLDIRLDAEQPNECWQSAFTSYSLPGDPDVEILTWLDDYSQLALSVTAHHGVTGPDVIATFQAAVAAYGCPASTLTGSDMVYTTRFSNGRGGSSDFEHELLRLGITQINAGPSHSETQQKVQRFHEALGSWLRDQPAQPGTVAELQCLLDTYTAYYNEQRPQSSLGSITPATSYAARPKVAPGARVGDTRHSRLSEVTLRLWDGTFVTAGAESCASAGR